ncbi:MAG TPA: DUF167 domain-containing protein, partial [Acidobacteriaceae bacterium]|nr:DUF167 domain-containing protein [Acidobacteriaceae bacterium]
SFLVRVTPRASRTAMQGVMGEGEKAAVKIALQAPPVEGRANAALIEFLAELLGVARGAIRIAGGEHGRNKRVVVRGRSAAEVAAKLKAGGSGEPGGGS